MKAKKEFDVNFWGPFIGGVLAIGLLCAISFLGQVLFGW